MENLPLAEVLRTALGRVIVDRLVMALMEPTALDRLANSGLRFDAYFQNDTLACSAPDTPCASTELLVSVGHKSRFFILASTSASSCMELTRLP